MHDRLIIKCNKQSYRCILSVLHKWGTLFGDDVHMSFWGAFTVQYC